VVINIFSPLENEAEDKRVRNDYHTEADLKKLSTPSPTNKHHSRAAVYN
jgi:hypothetical protein